MLVKKFEAKNMKEALLMIKKDLGPEAVIVSAKDIKGTFGLKGERSVEITAAIAEDIYQKKKILEKSLDEEKKVKFESISAKKQKEFINGIFKKEEIKKYSDELAEPRNLRYIDILDEEEKADKTIKNEIIVNEPPKNEHTENPRIKNAIQLARKSFSELNEDDVKPMKDPAKNMFLAKDNEIAELKTEILQLKKLFKNFSKMPSHFLSSYPGSEYSLNYEMSSLYKQLTDIGIESTLVGELLLEAKNTLGPINSKKTVLVEAWVAKKILEFIQVTGPNYESNFKIHCFVGGPGQGKSSMLVKMATHLALIKRKKVVILSTDAFKVGAQDQMKIYAQILNVPFLLLKSPINWEQVYKQYSYADYILVDYPGLGLKTSLELEWISRTLPSKSYSTCIHFVQSLMANQIDSKNLVQRYKNLNISDLIFTHLDHSSQYGLMLNTFREILSPLYVFGVGPQIPEDFEYSTKERVIDLMFKLTRLRKEAK